MQKMKADYLAVDALTWCRLVVMLFLSSSLHINDVASRIVQTRILTQPRR